MIDGSSTIFSLISPPCFQKRLDFDGLIENHVVSKLGCFMSTDRSCIYTHMVKDEDKMNGLPYWKYPVIVAGVVRRLFSLFLRQLGQM